MRGREFLMKDMYSFNVDEETHNDFYEKAKIAYKIIYDRLGIGGDTIITFSSGGTFSKYSHEFQTLCEAGEDIVYVDMEKKLAVNREVLNDEVLNDLGLKKENLKECKAIEVGNIFSLGTKFSSALGLNFKDKTGISKPVIMGCYGIGPTRVMGTIAEIWSDDKGLVWPESVAPFSIHLVALFGADGKVEKVASELYRHLSSKGIEVLYDDRQCSAGEKFSDADLIGIPWRYVVSSKTLESDAVEVKDRKTGNVSMKKIQSL
ncbi:MAG: His/Gly/Thr/Pro-type tRNA ligase C-terminal domain-containing protein [Candidatus Taylorbacteria bacterium]